MRMFLLALATAASLALTACGSDDKTVVVPPGGTAVIEDGHTKVCPAGQTC
jgi:hypothetical protein